ncbi:EamA family transporter [Promicromonospora umidemergens]|uniref:EamA family transporter n=1 Tax=Promicromonospora umidemergens TaxID=629679 RepID=A0ABP8WR20_9MICO|nr:EamA family transporter [Promicromonospora umidemergens]
MNVLDAPEGRSPSTAAAPQLSSSTATSRQRGAGIVMMLISSASNQTGAALGATAFPAIGAVGVVAVRQIVTALVLTPIVRPRLRGLSRDQWWPILGLVVVFSTMNLSLYAAIDRIGLGLAVTLEFLGPLAVAVASSRRLLDIGCAVLAGVGVVVLTNPGPTTDVIGVSLALLAAVAWGSYVLLNRTLGQRLPGLEGTAVASLITATAWTPILVVWFAVHTPTVMAITLAVACGLMSSIAPYVADLLALRRVPAQMFGTFTSINPVWAALAGWLLLHQSLDLHEWTGIGLIVLSNVIVSARGLAPTAKQVAPAGRPRR